MRSNVYINGQARSTFAPISLLLQPILFFLSTPSSLIVIDNLARPSVLIMELGSLLLSVYPESSGVFFFRLSNPKVFLLGFHFKATSSSEPQFTSYTLEVGIA